MLSIGIVRVGCARSGAGHPVLVGRLREDPDEDWAVLADPGGHHFCVIERVEWPEWLL